MLARHVLRIDQGGTVGTGGEHRDALGGAEGSRVFGGGDVDAHQAGVNLGVERSGGRHQDRRDGEDQDERVRVERIGSPFRRQRRTDMGCWDNVTNGE